MTPGQRDAAIRAMASNKKVRARNNVVPQQGPLPLDWVAEQMFDALLKDHVVLHKSEVVQTYTGCTWERP